MKFCKIIFLALAVCLPAAAQTHNGLQLNVPFDFVAAGKTLPAGHYTVTCISSADKVTWEIQSSASTAMVLTNSTESPLAAQGPSLVFLQSGGRYFLTQIWSGQHLGRQVMLGKAKQILVAENSHYVEIGAE